MRLLVEATWEKEEMGPDGETLYEKGQFWLHHWGIQHQIINIGNGTVGVGNWTVGICEDYKNGDIRCFLPEQLRIIGHEIKK